MASHCNRARLQSTIFYDKNMAINNKPTVENGITLQLGHSAIGRLTNMLLAVKMAQKDTKLKN